MGCHCLCVISEISILRSGVCQSHCLTVRQGNCALHTYSRLRQGATLVIISTPGTEDHGLESPPDVRCYRILNIAILLYF
jgi:hypothetical protein